MKTLYPTTFDLDRFHCEMTDPQLHPLEFNAKTKEPFLRLRKHKNIILTPPRWEDASSLVSILNDPLVHEWLSGPPYPYTLGRLFSFLWLVGTKGSSVVKFSDHGNEFIGLKINIAEQTLKELEDAKDDPTLKFVKECPVSYLREVKEDGSDVFIGSLNISTCLYGEMMGPDGVDWEIKKRMEDENNSLNTGDARIVWCFGGKSHLNCIRLLISIYYTRLSCYKSSSPRDHDRCSRHGAS